MIKETFDWVQPRGVRRRKQHVDLHASSRLQNHGMLVNPGIVQVENDVLAFVLLVAIN